MRYRLPDFVSTRTPDPARLKDQTPTLLGDDGPQSAGADEEHDGSASQQEQTREGTLIGHRHAADQEGRTERPEERGVRRPLDRPVAPALTGCPHRRELARQLGRPRGQAVQRQLGFLRGRSDTSDLERDGGGQGECRENPRGDPQAGADDPSTPPAGSSRPLSGAEGLVHE